MFAYEQQQMDRGRTGRREPANRTGIPIQMKAAFERKSGFSYDDVQVHYNSDEPEKINARAFTYGSQVFLGRGQECMLPHELGHVAQQKAGIVRPTHTLPGQVPLNLDPSLEREADGYIHRPELPGEGAAHRRAPSPALQGYFKVPPFVLSSRHPNHQGQPPQIMIREDEPAAVYFEAHVGRGAIPAELASLGITPSGDQVPGPQLPVPQAQHPPGPAQQVNQPVMYSKLTQGEIPPPHALKTRSHKEFQKVSERLDIQEGFLGKALEIANTVNAALAQGPGPAAAQQLNSARGDVNRLIVESYTINGAIGNLPPEPGAPWSSCIGRVLERLFGMQKKRRLSVGALGKDIVEAVLALYLITGNEIENRNLTPEDKQIILQLLQSELSFRQAQISAERQVLIRKPEAPTACDKSAAYRTSLIDNGVTTLKKAEFDKGVFDSEIPWTYHYATEIPVGDLTTDKLFIEDAVGKSADPRERAGAHWFARLYGTEENAQAGPAPAGQQQEGQQQEEQVQLIQPGSKFNHMSDDWRLHFFQGRGLEIGTHWRLNYVSFGLSVEAAVPLVTVRVIAGHRFEYQCTLPPEGADVDAFAAKRDFLIKTADEVLDGLVLQESAHTAMRQRYPGQRLGTTGDCERTIGKDFIPFPGLRWNGALEDIPLTGALPL